MIKEHDYIRLRHIVMNCKIAYYNQATSFVSDGLYDALEAAVMDIEERYPKWVKGIPLNKMIGADPEIRTTGMEGSITRI